jgi:hypothetical protein
MWKIEVEFDYNNITQSDYWIDMHLIDKDVQDENGFS